MMNKILPVIALLIAGCAGSNDYVPKPHGYPRMEFPKREYRYFDSLKLPYAFEIPIYAKMEKDTNSNLTAEATWYNLNFKPFNATLHITHYNFSNWAFFDSLVYDTRKLVNKHIQRADDILEQKISSNQKNVSGVMFKIEGNTATNLNFYLTDSAHNFFRGALYFNRQTEQDSIAPVYEFIRQDVEHLIQTFKWK